MSPAPLKLKILSHRPAELPLPKYQSASASGLDLVACEAGEIAPGQWATVPTGLAIELPHGFEAQVRPRSGLALEHGVTVLNAPGTIDADYRGEVKVLLVNHGRNPYRFHSGDRIAQLVVAQVVQANIEVVTELSPSVRGGGGFGHTGR